MKKHETKPDANPVAAKPEKDAAPAASNKAAAATASGAVPKPAEAAAGAPTAKVKAKAVPKKTEQMQSAAAVTDQPKKKPANPKAATKPAAVDAAAPARSAEISMHDRVGLTAGAIWHFLADNGPGPVAKLIKSLPEDSAIIQRGIGWLAQEHKIVLTDVNGTETIALTE